LTHALLAGSPAIDAGASIGLATLDQRGFARVGMYDIGAFELNGVPPPVELASAVSRKTHGTAGTFDVNLQLNDPIGIECRSGGAGGTHTMVLTFAEPLTNVDSAELTAGTGIVSSSQIDPDDPHLYVLNLTGVADAQRVAIGLTNVVDSLGENSGSLSIRMNVLLGDVNGDGVVNSADAVVTRNDSGLTTDATNFRADSNVDGAINSADATLVRGRSGNALPQKTAKILRRTGGFPAAIPH
ncbi:MAG: choice-of-anchor Q domain-containing protein, partial [Chthoniobacterales bacterium]